MTLQTAILVVQLATLVGFVLIAGLSLREWFRLRNPSQMYLAGAIGALAVVSFLGQVGGLLPASLKFVGSDLTLVAFLASGLALLLFRDAVIPLPAAARLTAELVTAGVGLVYVWASLVGLHEALPAAIQLGLLLLVSLTWTASVGEPIVRMWLVARRLPRVQRSRLRALCGGYAGIVALLAIVVASALALGSASTAPQVTLVTGLIGLAILPLLYAGFAPPAWLRRIWRQREETNFQAAIHDLLMFSQDRGELARRAVDWATRLAGAHAGFIAFPVATVIAARGVSEPRAGELAAELKGVTHPGVVKTAGGENAIVSPFVIDGTAGVLGLLAGPFTPVFATDEVAWINQYATLVATGLDRVRLVEAMGSLNDRLEAQVEEIKQRTAELQAANKELEAFSYTVSHDLRAPLRAINGFAGILLEEHAGELSPEVQGLLRRIADGGTRMGNLVDDLLAFSRVTRQTIRTQAVATRQLVERVWERIAETLVGRQVEIEIKDLPGCQSDPVLLEQVYVNLLSNAVKYSRLRPVAHIEVGATQQTQGETIFYVKDDGVGFDMQYANKLFGVFQRLHRSNDYEGTGVGLAIVQRIVNRHGGRVWAEAAPDQGATFYFTLNGGAQEWPKAA